MTGTQTTTNQIFLTAMATYTRLLASGVMPKICINLSFLAKRNASSCSRPPQWTIRDPTSRRRTWSSGRVDTRLTFCRSMTWDLWYKRTHSSWAKNSQGHSLMLIISAELCLKMGLSWTKSLGAESGTLWGPMMGRHNLINCLTHEQIPFHSTWTL